MALMLQELQPLKRTTPVGLWVQGTCKYMAIKASGIEDDPSTPDRDESRLIAFGYEESFME